MVKTKGIGTKEYSDLYYDEAGELKRFVSAMAEPRLRITFDKNHRPVYEITVRIDPSVEELAALIDWMRRPPVWVTFERVQLELPEPAQDQELRHDAP